MLYILIVILVYIPTGAILWGYVFEDMASNMESTVPFWKIVTLTTFIPITYLLFSWLYYWVITYFNKFFMTLGQFLNKPS